MTQQFGYCPFCGGEIFVQEIEVMSRNLIFAKCPNTHCRGRGIIVKADRHGFVTQPLERAGTYVFARIYTEAKP